MSPTRRDILRLADDAICRTCGGKGYVPIPGVVAR